MTTTPYGDRRDIQDQRYDWDGPKFKTCYASPEEEEVCQKIMDKYPGFDVWHAMTGRLWYARERGRMDRASLITGEDPEDLEDEIRAWIGKHAKG